MNKKLSNKPLLKYFLLSMIVLETIFFILLVFLYLPKISRRLKTSDFQNSARKYHFIIAGNSENFDFLSKIYNGAKAFSETADAAIELHVPSSKAEDKPLTELIDYAAFLNADGIIAYINDDSPVIDIPVRADGSEIPLVTLGINRPEIPQISYIGNNFSETGKILALEAVAIYSENSDIIILAENESFTGLTSVISNIQLKLRNNNIENFKLLDRDEKRNALEFRRILKDFQNSTKELIILCLSENDAALACQEISDYGLEKRAKIIAFGDNEITRHYFSSGILYEIISTDTEKSGEMAIRELIEYIKYGSANRIVTSDIKLETFGGNLK